MKVRLQKNPPSGTIILGDSSNHNALSRQMIQDLIQALGDFHREKSVRAVILTSTGSTFCSGVDLKEWSEIHGTDDALEVWQDLATELQELVETMLRFPKPIIAAVDGKVIGAGLAILLAADLVVGTPQASLYSNAPKLGLVSGIVAPLLTFRLGAAIASRLLLANEPLSADQAHGWGLFQYKTTSDLVWVKASQLASQIAETSVESMQMTKRLLNEMIGESLWTHLISGAAVMATVCSTDAAAEGLKSFKEKRTPQFP
jgi:methylglutaconyl-CoA hydratase